MGLSSKHKDKGNDVVYIMKVSEVLTFDEYFRKHPEKRPDFTKGKVNRIFKQGDNIYMPEKGGGYTQLRSCHSLIPNDDQMWATNIDNLKRDLSGNCVLLSDHFVYFGSDPLPLPHELKECIAGRGHRCRFDDDVLATFSIFVDGLKQDLQNNAVKAAPAIWSIEDESWKQ